MIAWSSTLTWARLNRSTRVTPSRCRMRETILSLSGCCRKIRMSAVCSGAWNGPGGWTAWSLGDEDGDVLALGVREGSLEPAVGSAEVVDDPSPHAERTST